MGRIQQGYHAKTGSRKCEVKWTATLAEKVIDIVSDLWKHRNDALHNRDNFVQQRDHNKLNREIKESIDKLPRSLRVFSAAEEQFFKRTKVPQLKQCKILQKQQWIDTAQSILEGLQEKLDSNLQARAMVWEAMNLLPSAQR